MGIAFNQMEFADNPEPRCPCVLLLDTSGSMSGEPIRLLNQGLRLFQQELSADSLAALRAEVAIVTFGNSVSIAQEFVTAGQFYPPTLNASGPTPMGQAIHTALNLIEQRKQTYKNNGVAYYRPWIFMLTDGEPTDDWQAAAQRVREEEQRKKVAFFTVGIGHPDAWAVVLRQISVRQPLPLDGLKFGKMFEWLSTSLGSVSRSKPGEEVTLQSPAGWAAV